MPKKMLKDKERTILQYIHQQMGSVNAHQIATGTGISYITVKKYLGKLVREKLLIEEENEK